MKKCNKKGMTLVEVLVAMTILGIMSALFVSVAVAAKKQNRDNAKRSAEMYEQAAAAEDFDPTKEYSDDELKVKKMLSSGTSNAYTIEAPFPDYNIKTIAAGYQVTRRGEDNKGGSYSLRFFKSDYVDIVPELEPGEYWVRLVNESGGDLDMFVSTPDGNLFNVYRETLGDEFTNVFMNKGRLEFGFKPGDKGLENLFGFSENEGLFTDVHSISGWDKIITRDDFAKYLDTNESGEIMNTITIYFYEGSLYSKAEYEAATAAPTT